MHAVLQSFLETSASVKTAMAADTALRADFARAAERLLQTVRSGGVVYTCGNGGSACDAMHFAEELVARYKRTRPGIKAMHLLDPGVLSCWSNDFEFSTVFERQVETFCGANDTLVAISTSGNSPNILKAVTAAKKQSTFTIGLTGKGGGEMKSLCDISLVVPSDETDRVQEAHITLIHAFCEIIETR